MASIWIICIIYGRRRAVVPRLEIWIHVSIYKDTFVGYDDLRGSLLHWRRKQQSVSELIKHEHA